MNLIHYQKKPPSRISLLSLLAKNQRTLQDMSELKSEGGGSFINGLGKALGKTISSLANGSSQIIRAFGQSFHDGFEGIKDFDVEMVNSIGNATSKVITSSTTGIAKIFSSFGGLSGFLQWILILLIIAYLVLNRMQNPPYLSYFLQDQHFDHSPKFQQCFPYERLLSHQKKSL